LSIICVEILYGTKITTLQRLIFDVDPVQNSMVLAS